MRRDLRLGHSDPLLLLAASLSIIPLVLCLGGRPCAASPAFQTGRELARLVGRVYGEHGQNLTHARVRLETAEGELVFEVSPDEQGRYNFTGLQRAVYHLSATADGYETFRQTVDLTRTPTHIIVDIAMTPLDRGVPTGDPPSLTDASAPRKARQEYQKGIRDLAANRIPEAKSHFTKAVDKYPCYARALDAVALGFISDRDLPRAEAALKKSIQCDPGYSSSYLKLGELYNIEGRFRESEPVLQEGLRREPGLWKFHYQLGAAYFGLGAYDKAQEEYVRSESLNPPAPPDVHVKLADAYFKQHYFGRAYAEMKSYLREDPNGRFANKVKDLIRQMDAYRTPRDTTPSSAAASPATDASSPQP